MKILHMVKGMQTIICDHYKSINCGSPLVPETKTSSE